MYMNTFSHVSLSLDICSEDSFRHQQTRAGMCDTPGTPTEGIEELFQGSLLTDRMDHGREPDVMEDLTEYGPMVNIMPDWIKLAMEVQRDTTSADTPTTSPVSDDTTTTSPVNDADDTTTTSPSAKPFKRRTSTAHRILMEDLEKYEILQDAVLHGKPTGHLTPSMYERGNMFVRDDTLSPARKKLRMKHVKITHLTTLVHAVFTVFNNWGPSGADAMHPRKYFEDNIASAVNLIKYKFQDPTSPVYSHSGDVGSEIIRHLFHTGAGMNYMSFAHVDGGNKHVNDLVTMVWPDLPAGAIIPFAYCQIVCIVSAFVLVNCNVQDAVLQQMIQQSFEREVKVSFGEFWGAYNILSHKCRAVVTPPLQSVSP
jgi:hypothetical protein